MGPQKFSPYFVDVVIFLITQPDGGTLHEELCAILQSLSQDN